MCDYDLDGCSVSTPSSDTTAPVITLSGVNPQTIEIGSSYIELNASADDASHIDINSTNVDTNTIGTYTVTYNATDTSGNHATEVTRTVYIVDTTAPVITLNGASTIDVVLDQTYTEQNATANDARDGNVLVVITGTVNTATLENYTITYTATDVAGNIATDIRTVSVIVRFSRNASTEIVTDLLDGVMWQDDENAELISGNWLGAKIYCTNLTLGGYSDWELPDISRLNTIVDGARNDPACEY